MTKTSFAGRRREFNAATAVRKFATAWKIYGDPRHALTPARITLPAFYADPAVPQT